jgi:hypothetical protein
LSLTVAREMKHAVSVPTPQTVRLKVAYKHPESLIGEFTRSVGQGAVALECRKAVPTGTRFIFELHAQGYPEAVEVAGEVIAVTEQDPGRYLLTIRYEPASERTGLDALLLGLMKRQQAERIREYPRVPLQLRATEEAPYSPAYRVLDLSLGGMGVEIEAPILPRAVKVGTPFLADVWLNAGALVLHGEIAWTATTPSVQRWVHPRFGVHFGRLRDDTRERLERILMLRGLPPPPWKARVSFGMDAVSRMP